MAFDKYKIDVNQLDKTLSIISMIISGLLALSSVILILNPKLSFKIYYDKDNDGNARRPKIIHLALTEWLAIFTYFASPLAVVLLLII